MPRPTLGSLTIVSSAIVGLAPFKDEKICMPSLFGRMLRVLAPEKGLSEGHVTIVRTCLQGVSGLHAAKYNCNPTYGSRRPAS